MKIFDREVALPVYRDRWARYELLHVQVPEELSVRILIPRADHDAKQEPRR